MPDARARFRSLLYPDECTVIVIAGAGSSSAAAAPLLEAAQTHGVAAIALIVDGAAGGVHGCTALICGRFNPLEDPEVRRALASLGRSRLLIGGDQAETVLTFTVLSALEDGYDVYLLRDLIAGTSESLADTAVARMVQAGAVPVSTMQVIAEWGCETGKAATRRFRKAG